MKYAVRAIVAILVIAGLVAAVAIFGDTIMFKLNRWQAGNAVEDGDVSLAISKYEEALDYRPKDTGTRVKLAQLYLQKDNGARAEKVLFDGLKLLPGDTALLTQLSAAFVQQDKLSDAVELLDQNNSLIGGLQEQRPQLLIPNVDPGVYNSEQNITFTLPADTRVYYSTDGSYPSSLTEAYSQPIHVGSGVTTLMAVAVNTEGLVGALWQGEYTVEHVVMPVDFVDDNMEALIRKTLDSPTEALYSNDLWGITTLDNTGTGIIPASLDDLQWLTGLESLVIVGDGTQTYDLTSLKTVTALSSLTLDNCNLDATEFDTIVSCGWLTQLRLPRNHITSLSPITALTRLQLLDVSANNLTDIAPLSGLTTLTSLNLSENTVSSLSALGGLVHLTSLGLKGCQLANLNALTPLVELAALDISDNSLTELVGLEGLAKLETLNLSHNSVEQLQPLSGLPSLKTLDISLNKVKTVVPLFQCRNLKTVKAFGNDITDSSTTLVTAPFALERN